MHSSSRLRRLRESIMSSARVVLWGLVNPRLWVLLAASLVVWSFAYQYKTTYTVDVGGMGDDAFVQNFNAKEHNGDLGYRWSRGSAAVLFSGLGNEPVVVSITATGYRPSGDAPVAQIGVRGRTFAFQTGAEARTASYVVPRGNIWDGDLKVDINTPTFTPSGDPRELGLIVDRVSVAPADYGLRPVVVPSPPTMFGLLIGLLLIYLSASASMRSPALALAMAAGLSATAAVLLVVSRLELALLAENLPTLGAWGLILAVAGWAALTLLIPSRHAWSKFTQPVGTVAFVLAFLIRFGGLTYPQFLSSDILLHVHNTVQRVMQGQWVFPGYLPDGTPVPYPPALYILLSPLAAIFGTSDEAVSLLLKWAASLLDASTCLALAWAGARLRMGSAGALAAIVYALSPAPFDLFSAGNYTNLFAQSVFNLTMLGALVFLADHRDVGYRAGAIWFSLGFGLTMLGHYGMMLGALTIGGIFGIWLLVMNWRSQEAARRQASGDGWMVVGALVLAAAASFALYYRNFTSEIWAQFADLFQRLSGEGKQAAGSGQHAANTFSRLGMKLGTLIGVAPLVTGLSGLLLIRLPRQAVALLSSWLLAGAIFFLLDQAVGDAIRWYYLAAAPIALLTGRYLALLLRRGTAATVLVVLSLAAMLMQLLYFWVGDLIFTRYH
jgi:hypothetical protein